TIPLDPDINFLKLARILSFSNSSAYNPWPQIIMSSHYRYGDFTARGGSSASELAQARTDAQTESIRRPGIKINVMSDETWNKLIKEAEGRRLKKEAKLQQQLLERHATAKEAAMKVLPPYLAMVRRQRLYQEQLAKKLKAYHEKPEDDTTTSDEWKTAYTEVARLLAAALISYHYQMDMDRGDVKGPDYNKFYITGIPLDTPESATLEAYLAHRHVPVSGEEVKYFESLIAKQADLPIFILAATEDNLVRISQTKGSSLAAPKAILEFVIEDYLIREEIVEIFLDPESQ
ncbi:hypothetical protein FGRMN_11174, partial [Fusarium graminum]